MGLGIDGPSYHSSHGYSTSTKNLVASTRLQALCSLGMTPTIQELPPPPRMINHNDEEVQLLGKWNPDSYLLDIVTSPSRIPSYGRALVSGVQPNNECPIRWRMGYTANPVSTIIFCPIGANFDVVDDDWP